MGIKNLFKKNRPLPAVENNQLSAVSEQNEATADFIEVQSLWGVTYHALPNLDRKGAIRQKATLCGITTWERTPTSNPINSTIASATRPADRTWNYCPRCRDALAVIETGQVPAESFPNTQLLDLRQYKL